MGKVLAKAVLRRGDKLLILKRSKTDVRRPLQWDLAGGGVEESEYIEEACAREVKEESGLAIGIGDLELLFAYTEYLEGNGNTSWLIFGAAAPDGEVILSDEHCDYAWVSLDKAIQMVTYERQLRFLKYIQYHDLLK